MSVRVLVSFLAICLLAGIWVAGNDVVRADGNSEVVAAATLPGAPRQVRVEAHVAHDDATELDVSWLAPQDDGGSPVTSYKVQWKLASASWDTTEDVSWRWANGTTPRTHRIRGLTEGTGYAVRVIAVNAVGDSPPSEPNIGAPYDRTTSTFFHHDVHGDTTATATDLPFGTEYAILARYIGAIYPADDIDYFRLTVTSEEAGYVFLRLREFAKQLEWRSYVNGVLLTETGECVVYKCDSDLTENSVVYLKEGVYYLQVSAVEGNGQPDSVVAQRGYGVAWGTQFLH